MSKSCARFFVEVAILLTTFELLARKIGHGIPAPWPESHWPMLRLRASLRSRAPPSQNTLLKIGLLETLS